LAHGGWFDVCWIPTSTIRFSAETSTAFNFPPQLPRTPVSTLAQEFPKKGTFQMAVDKISKALFWGRQIATRFPSLKIERKKRQQRKM
ncbi:hypothetical protein KDX11_24470, partial [Burkholderia cenocepacia]|uniref:hypothetical protein n=1 Tax=Burkholderia cenocepacia TaxID=95486 RepID=UPI001B9B3248